MTAKKINYFTIPNIITMLNIASGSFAIFLAIEKESNLYMAAAFVALAMVFDFFDGFAARLLKISSEIGKQLDSLADLISFGFAPAAILFQLLKSADKIKVLTLDTPFLDILILSTPIFLVIFSALRLAKFNIDTRQTSSFIGLPTPAAALFVISMAFLKEFDPYDLLILSEWVGIDMARPWVLNLGFKIFVLESIYFYMGIIAIFSMLLVVEIPMFSLKFKNFSFKDNRRRYVFLTTSLIMLILFQEFAVPFVILLFISFSIALNIRDRSKNGNSNELAIIDDFENFDIVKEEEVPDFKFSKSLKE